MFWRFKEDAVTLFLDIHSTFNVDTTKKYNILLSPSLYWVKKVSLPLKYAHEVKKIAPTIFEEILPDGNYSYYVYKEGDEFFLFAYEDRKILELLESKKLSLSSIRGIYFAQTIFAELEEIYRVSDESVIVQKEGIAVLLPASWYSDKDLHEFKEPKSLKHAIKLQQFGHIVESAILYKIIALLAAFCLVLLLEYFVLLKQKEDIVEAGGAVFSEHHLKPTMMQNRAILSHYKTQYLEQKKLRESIISLLKASLKKEEHIETVALKNNILYVSFSGVKASQKRRVVANLSKVKIPFQTRYVGEKLVVEVKL